jgi:hypothetical protein
MYVTQTYLGFSAKGAKAYVYFLSEEYMSNRQRDLHTAFVNRAAEFGLTSGKEVAVLLPVPGSEMKVLGSDLSDEGDSPVQRFYRDHIAGQTPGLLVTGAPIDTKRGLKGAVFFSFNSEEHPFRAAKKLVAQLTSAPSGGGLVQFLERLNEFVYLRPNLYGLGLDLNAMIDRGIEKLKD